MKNLSLYFRFHKTRIINRGIRYTFKLLRFQIFQFFSHSALLKASNFIGDKVQKYLKRDKVVGMPYRYTIDPINICNLRCPLCPNGLGILGRKKGRMDFNNYKLLIDQIAPYAYYVELFNWGEPFLHPQIFDFIYYASSHRIAVRISSNLNHFSSDMAVKTISSGLDALIVSVDGATQEVYEKYRQGGNLSRVLENITLLIEERKKARRRNPFITLRTLINRYNENQIDQMRELAGDLGVDAFSTMTTFVNTNDPKQIEEWLPNNEELSYYDYSSKRLETILNCPDPWESVTINWDGGLSPCCWIHNKQYDFGNVFIQPLRKIWNSNAYVSSRRIFSLGNSRYETIKTICTLCMGRPKYLLD